MTSGNLIGINIHSYSPFSYTEAPMEEVEKFFKCPYCFERISMVLDTSVDDYQTYIEDCEVCCNPIQISYSIDEGKVKGFQSERTQ